MVFNRLFRRVVYGMIVISTLAPPAGAQVTVRLNAKQRRISVRAEQVSLGTVLEELFEEGMPLYYSSEYIPVDATVSLNEKDLSWDDFIDLLCRKAHLKSAVRDHHYVLHYLAPEAPADTSDISANSVDPGDMKTKRPPPAADLIHLPVTPSSRYDGPVVPVPAPPAPGLSSRAGRWRLVSLTGVYGPVFPVCHFKAGLTPDQYYESGHHSEWGILTGLTTPVKRLKVTSGLTYMTTGFTYVYNYRMLDAADPFPIADETRVKTAWIELPVRADYQLWRYHDLTALLTAGVFTRYKIRDQETTYYKNAADRETGQFLSAIRTFSLGAMLGYEIRYRVVSGWHILVSMACLQHFYRLDPEVMKVAMTEFCLQAGVNYSFH